MRKYKGVLLFFLFTTLLIGVISILKSIRTNKSKISHRRPDILLVNETLSDTLLGNMFNRISSQIENVKVSVKPDIVPRKNRIWTKIMGPRTLSDLIDSVSKIIQCDRIIWDDRSTSIQILLGRDLLVPLGKGEYWIKVQKSKCNLQLMKNGKSIHTYRVAVGSVSGDKERARDCRTPEGLFWISTIENSHNWVFDFNDGLGPIRGAYGPYFFRLYTGGETTLSGQSWEGIGIHGTHDPSTIGTPSSHGCIRMHNRDLTDLKSYIQINMPVLIMP